MPKFDVHKTHQHNFSAKNRFNTKYMQSNLWAPLTCAKTYWPKIVAPDFCSQNSLCLKLTGTNLLLIFLLPSKCNKT